MPVIADHLYRGARQDLWAELPMAGRLLDVGCAAGDLGRELRAHRPNLRVVGVEVNPVAAGVAATVLERVHSLDIEQCDIPEADASFDCVLFADVLEHLADPWAALRRCRRLVAPHGRVVVSIPNVGHHSTFRHLLAQDWPLADGGLFDRTHLRFFTRKTVLSLLSSTGYRAIAVRPKGPLSAKWRLVHLLTAGKLTDFGIYGFVVTAAPATHVP